MDNRIAVLVYLFLVLRSSRPIRTDQLVNILICLTELGTHKDELIKALDLTKKAEELDEYIMDELKRVLATIVDKHEHQISDQKDGTKMLQ